MIGVSKSWLKSLENVNAQNEVSVTRVLFLTTLFFGIRMRFLEDGGILLLSSSKEEEKVDKAYEEIKKNYKWAGEETHLRISTLQKFYMDYTKKKGPLLFTEFKNEVDFNTNFQESRELLCKWLSEQKNVDTLKEKVKEFSSNFKGAIDKLYTAWSD